uniref:UDP-glucuronosyltransferase 2B20 n=1 Tax=Cacopsylla melanoneura TaxID=428564 RepID=A0A8D9AQC7_9HEMI
MASSVTLLFLLAAIGFTAGHNILAIFPHHGQSHFMTVKPYLKELARRGDNLTVIGFYPLKPHERMKNYHDISLDGCLEMHNNNVSFSLFEGPVTYISRTLHNTIALYLMSGEVTSSIFRVPALKEFIHRVLNDGHNFDLVIVETFQMDVFLGLIHRMNVPFISVTTCNLFAWSSERIGQPQNPSYVPTNQDVYSTKMTLVERVKNTMSLLFTQFAFHYLFVPKDQKIANEQFGPGLPPLPEIAKNTSLILANIHFSLNLPRPVVPQLIEVGGLHIQPAKPLTKDLQQFLNSSTNGVIYFCMGSMLRGETFPLEKRQAFLAAFSKLPYNVLWKYEGDTLPGQPSNVKILSWTPQRDILSHPNVKLFINHGGLLGTIEAVYEGVPMLGIPMFGDQHINMNAIQSLGAGLVLDYKTLSQHTILNGIRTVLKPEYKMNAKRLQAQYRDRPTTAMETAIYWTDYVLRHKGAPHLRTAAVHMPWYQLLCLDILFIMLVAFITLVFIMKITLSLLLRQIFHSKATKNKTD